MGVGLGEAADDGIVVPGAEVVGPGLPVQILSAVAEGVGIGGILGLLVAEGVVVTAIG